MTAKETKLKRESNDGREIISQDNKLQVTSDNAVTATSLPQPVEGAKALNTKRSSALL